jgi:hypothetical protein
MRRICSRFSILMVVPLLFVSTARGQAGPLITIDEFGHGNVNGVPLQFQISPDPGPGGLPQVLNYFPLPFAGVQGDVRMQDPLEQNLFLDVIRFNGDGRIFFYSDNLDGFDAPADTPSPPASFYTNVALIQEQGPEGGFQDAFYSPQPGQPGFDPSLPTYHFVSDGVVPEPASLSLLIAGIFAAACYGCVRQSRKPVV